MPPLYPQVGMIIPVWYPSSAAPDLVDALLARALDGCELYCRPEHTLLVQDGQPLWRAKVQLEAEKRGFLYHCLAENQGKGRAVAAGIPILAATGVDFMVTRDSDGDTQVHDLPALAGLALQMAAETGSDLIIASGGRSDRVRPLGLERAEYEQLTDRFLWQALQYDAARRGRRLSEAYFATYGDWPDIQSGYKVYSARAAALAAEVLGSPGGEDGGDSLTRCGVETLPAIEILTRGGYLGVMARHTDLEQPVSGYRDVDALSMYARPLVWVCRRLSLPAKVAASLLDDSLLRSDLLFDAPKRDRALAVREHVLGAMDYAHPLVWGGRYF
jgi:hypothetical protein